VLTVGGVMGLAQGLRRVPVSAAAAPARPRVLAQLARVPRRVLIAVVLATAVGGIPEQVVDGETGLVVGRPADAESSARAISRLLADQSLRSAMGVASRRRAEASFDYDRLAPRLAARLADMEG